MTSYSHRTLRNKLGIHAGMRLYFERMPSDVHAAIGDLDDDTTVVHDPQLVNYFHDFITARRS